MKTRITSALIAAALLTAVNPVHAETETPPPRSEPAVTTTETFGGQVVLADLLGLATGYALAVGAEQGFGLLLYPLASPAVHLYHGDVSGAVGTFFLHLGTPLVGGIVGYAIDSSTCNGEREMFCGLGGFALGVLGGMVAATVLDATLLSSVTHTTPTRQSRRSFATPTIALAPRGGLVLGFAGSL